jgi:hypothetical protein
LPRWFLDALKAAFPLLRTATLQNTTQKFQKTSEGNSETAMKAYPTPTQTPIYRPK